MRRRRWIRHAIKRRGALSRQLRIPERENIPITLLRRIRAAPIGATVRNPTTKGRRTIRVTRLVKRRAVLALTLKRIARR